MQFPDLPWVFNFKLSFYLDRDEVSQIRNHYFLNFKEYIYSMLPTTFDKSLATCLMFKEELPLNPIR